MKFNPLTKTIYTDNGDFVKAMNCPCKVRWDNLEATTSTTRKCTNCAHSIVDTAALTDDDLLDIVSQHPDTCLKIDLNQSNLSIITNGIFEQK